MIRRFAVTLAALFSIACFGTNEIDPPCGTRGTFDAEISGEITVPNPSISGCASYDVQGQPASWRMTLDAPGAPAYAFSFSRVGDRPVAGTYQLGPSTPFITTFVISDGSSNRTFSVTSGTLRVDTSVPGDMRGSINLSTTESGSNATANVAITYGATCRASGQLTC